MKQRILNLLCALALCLSLLPATALADDPTDNWEDVVTSQPEGYTVDASGNVTISSAEGLAWLSKQSRDNNFSGVTVTLTEDIDLSAHYWTPIGPSSKDFRGTFDGQNHTITGLTIVRGTTNAGLFAYIYGGAVKNVRLVDCSITCTSTYTAGICGYNSSGTIENCHVLSGSIHGSQYTGGICGQCSLNSKVSGCSNAAGISSGTGYVGGICADADNKTQIINCTNSGTVTASGGTGYVGGICGTVMNTESNGVSISGCVNAGAVTAAYANNVGGICGGFSDKSVSLSDCLNTGDVKGYSYVGGIVGHRFSNTELAHCLNTGEVSGTGSSIDPFCPAGGGTTTKCYSIDKSSDPSCTEVTQAQLESGEVAYLLQDGRYDTIWGQLLSGSGDPQPSDNNRLVKITVVPLDGGDNTSFYANAGIPATNYPDGYAFFEDEDCAVAIITGEKTYSEDTTIYAKLSASTSATVTSAPTANTLTYTSGAQALVTPGEATGGTMVYRLGTDGTFTDQIPTATYAGEYTVWYKAAGDNGHSDSAEDSVKVTINPKDLIVTAINQSKTYGEADPELIYYYASVFQGDSLSGEMSRTAGETVGTYAITRGTLTNSNYTITFIEGVFTITAKPVTLTWSATTEFTYNGSEHSVTAEVTNSADGDTFALTYDDNAKTDVGTYTAKVTGLGNDNYTLDGATGITQTWSITAAAINPNNVSLSPDTATYNGAAHALTVLVDGKELSSADYDLSYKDADGSEVTELIDAGTYKVTVTCKGNYSGKVTLPYTISPAALTITDATLADKTYDETTAATVTGVSFDGGSPALGTDYTATAEFTDANAGTDKTAIVTVTLKSGNYTLAENTYNLTGQTIKKANFNGITEITGSVLANWADSVTLPAIPDGAVYGTPTSNDVTDMSITGSTLSYTGGSGVTTGGTYTVTVPVTGATNYNDYNITVTLTGRGKETLSITGVTAQNATYNGQAHTGYTGTPTAEGYDGGFTVTYSADPVNAGNYSVTIAIPDSVPQYTGSVTLNFTIAPAQVTVTALDRNIYTGQKAPDLSAPASGVDYEVSGLLGEDTLGGTVTMEYRKDGAAVTPNVYAPGEYDIAISCAGTNPNYAVTCVKGKLTVYINPSSLPDVYNVTVAPTSHGSVSVSPSNASQGVTVTVTVTPAEGYELASLTVTDEGGTKIAVKGSGSTYTFTMPGSGVTVTAVFRERGSACDHGATCPLRAFNDLDAYAWYHDGVHYCLENGLMEGVDVALFAPNANMTRAMVWAILARIDGVTVTGANWAETARAWAMANGVSDGTSANGYVTREQFVTMLWRFAGEPESSRSLVEYADAASVSDWAAEAMSWAVETGIIEGVTDTTIVPQSTAIRAQAATMLMRFSYNDK